MAGFIRANSAWTTVQKGFVYANGAWRSVQKGFVYANSAWRQFFPGGLTPVIAAQVTIAKSGSGTVTLTGTNRRWTNFASGVYYFNRSINDSTWTLMDTGSITNPSVGGTNTKTYVLTQSDVIANTTNYYQFVVSVTSSTSTTATSISSSTTVEGTRNITDLSSSSVSTTSITLSWTASQYAGSQVVQYKQSSSGTWIDHSTQTGATTSTLILGLVGGVSYDFRVLPYTGASATGYYGNYSNTYTVSTTALKPPNAVLNLTASNVQTTYLTISWNAPTVDATHDAATYYYYDYNTNGATPTGGNLTFSTSVTLSAGTLSSNTFYYLWVQAYNGDGGGPWTFTTATTQSAVLIPGQVTGLSHTKSYSSYSFSTDLVRNSATVKTQTWTYTVLVYYNLSWSAPVNASYYEITSNSVNSNPGVGYYTSYSTSYSDVQFQTDRGTVTSYYWVRAISSTGNAGPWSAVTGGTSTATVISGNWSLELWRCNNSAVTTASQAGTTMSRTWTGVNASFTHYATISGVIAGSYESRSSSGCV
jgi:autotransporter-associated beta strand protein